MATRRVPVRPAPGPSSTTDSGPIDFKNLVRSSALDVRQLTDVSSSALYNLCRTKSNQVMMMKRRGYTISPEEEVWIQCSLSEDVLIRQVRGLMGMKMNEIMKKVMNKTYTLERRMIPSQTAYTYYPYLESDGEEQLKVGEFMFRNGGWELVRYEEDIMEVRTFPTEVIYSETLNVSNFEVVTSFSKIAKKIIVHTGTEDSFRKELENMVMYRRQGIEIFHMSELFIDYFQHWLVPQQEIVRDLDKVRLLSSHLMIKDDKGVYQKVPNCKFTETGLPYIHHTDIVIRYIGALPGDIIQWENESYISSFVTKEFGYMLVVGHKYGSLRQADENTFAGERVRTSDDLDEDEDMEDEEVIDETIEEEDDMGGEEDD
jgi:DNA-directed RNA polymerase subunit H (RpoH/RPB5)